MSEKDFLATIEVLKARVAKLNGWLDEHEKALSKARRRINDADRRVAEFVRSYQGSSHG